MFATKAANEKRIPTETAVNPFSYEQDRARRKKPTDQMEAT
jgi:hypothetical protein